jgi:hypothetical protein
MIFTKQILWRMMLAISLVPLTACAQTSPQIGYLFPAGGQRGSTVDVNLAGKYMPGPCGVWSDGKGVTSQSETTTGKLKLTIAKDAALRNRLIRIYSAQGGSTPRPFVVGEFSEVIEHDNETPQAISFPRTVNGQLNPQGDVDQFKLSLQAGQQIVCAVAARSIGSPADTTLRLLDSAGRIVAIANDHRGLDPLLAYRCSKTGDFTLQLYNFDLSGRPEHVYRLTVTAGPYIDYAFPPGLQAGVKSTIKLFGWNLADGETADYSATPAATDSTHEISLINGANRLTVPVNSAPEILETEPNNNTESAQAITLPVTVNAVLQDRGDIDVYRFTAKKGQKVQIEVAAATLGFATDAVLSVSNDKGKLIKTVDDAGGTRDPSYLFTATADGDYLVTISERAGRGNSELIYRLVFREQKPDLQLTVKTSEFAVKHGESIEIPVTLRKIDGFAEEIEVTAVDLPKGVTVEAQKLPVKSPASVKLKFQTAKDIPFPAKAIRIVARSKLNGQPIERFAQATVTLVPDVKPIRTDRLWFAVRPHIPFSLSTTSVILEANRMAAFQFPVKVTRDEGFVAAIKLVGVDPDRRGTVVPLTGVIEKDQNAGSIPLIIQKKAIEGTTHRSRVMGVIDVQGPDGKKYPVFHVGKGAMAMGCQPNLLTLEVTPDQAVWRAGETVKITVIAVRRTTMNDVSIKAIIPRNLSGITVAPIKLATDQVQATMELHIDKTAQLPPRGSIQFRAESSRDGLPIYATTTLSLVAP